EEPRRLYRHDMWAGAYLIGGGCSDDGFISFRARLIAQGRDWYKKASPDSLPTIPPWQAADSPPRRSSVPHSGTSGGIDSGIADTVPRDQFIRAVTGPE